VSTGYVISTALKWYRIKVEIIKCLDTDGVTIRPCFDMAELISCRKFVYVIQYVILLNRKWPDTIYCKSSETFKFSYQ